MSTTDTVVSLTYDIADSMEYEMSGRCPAAADNRDGPPKLEPKQEPETVEMADEETALPVDSLYTLSEIPPTESDRFMVSKRSAYLEISPTVNEAKDPQEAMANVLDHVFRKLVKGETHVGLSLRHGETANEIRIPVRPVGNFNGHVILREIERKIQSAGHNLALTDGKLTLEVILANDGPSGSGRTRKSLLNTIVSAEEPGNAKSWGKSITKVPGRDKCLLKAFVLGRLFINYTKEDGTAERAKLRRRFENLQRPRLSKSLDAEAMAVMNRSGIRKVRNYTLEDLGKLQDAYPQYQIVCYDKEGHPFFTGPPVTCASNVMGLLLDRDAQGKGHFLHIKRLNTFIGTGFYCQICKVKFGHGKEHYNCPLVCQRCGLRTDDGILRDCEGDAAIKCADCNRTFTSDTCYLRHKQTGARNGRSWCESAKVCSECKSVITDRHEHVCYHRYCHTCQVDRTVGHVCSISKLKPPYPNKEVRVVFDIETCLYKKEHRGVEYDFHIPMLIVALRSCLGCRHYTPKSIDDEATCTECGNEDIGFRRIKVFECFDADLSENKVTEQFVEWTKLHKNTTFIAHNLKGFDGQFVLAQLEKGNVAPTTVLSGRKVMLMTVGKNRFVDSLNFLPMKLAAFSKAFGLEELKKGYFPHKLNKPENFAMPVSCVPDMEYYCPEGMSTAELSNFQKWHAEQRENGVQFDFKGDILSYCYSDVVLLSEGIHKFSVQFYRQTSIRPFEESATIASAAMQVFRRNFVVEGQIAITQPLSTGAKQSRLAACYLEWYAHENGVHVQHKYRGGEFQIPGTRYFADGYIAPTNGQKGKIIEVHGCYFHLHTCKYDRFSTMHGESYATVTTRDQLKREEIERNYDLEVVWECAILKDLRNNRDMKEFFNKCTFEAQVDFRDGFYGGRVEVFTLRMDKQPDETLAYNDYCSLYPSANKYGAYPVGQGELVHPDKIPVPISRVEELNVKGFLRCRVSAPRSLKIPVLPYRAQDVLLFGTCKSCMESGERNDCTHEEDERQFVGTWATAELECALRKGYTISEVYAAHHWEEWAQHDTTFPENDPRRYGPFSKYIDSFVKLKTEASGYPDGCITQAQKAAYVEEFYQLEGIRLSPYKIRKNPEARQVAKLLLNSLWGKMGQRTDMKNVMYINDPLEFWSMLNDPQFEILDVSMCGTEMLKVHHTGGTENKKVPAYLSVPYAALTTTYGRLRLYEALDNIPPEDIAYADTDSIIYRHKGADPLQQLIGNGLGQLTNEIPHGMVMGTFVGQGPKCYAYTLLDVTQQKVGTVVKCRGFKQTHGAALKVNFESVARHVEQLDKDDEVEIIYVDYSIIQNNGQHSLFNMNQIKKFDAMFRKRRLVGEYRTLPYGYSS